MKVTGHMIGYLVVAGICVAYGLLVRMNASGTAFYMIWFGIGIVFGFLALLSSVGIWAKMSVGVKTAAGIVVVILAAGVIIIEGLIITGFQEKGESGLDYVIVLGAQVKGDSPSIVLSYRLREAEKYLKENPETMCVVSGGQGDNEDCTEASVMGEYLKTHGIAEERIIYEDQSVNTNENMINSRKLIPESAKVGIITNNFHMYRAMRIAKKNGFDNVCGIAADSTVLYLPHNMLRELFGVIKFWLGF